MTAAAEAAQHRPFRLHRVVSRSIIDRRQEVARGRIVVAALDSKRSLTDRGEHPGVVENFGDAIGQPQTHQARLGKDRRIEILLGELAQAGLHVAADIDELEIGPAMEELRFASQAAGSHYSARRQGLE